MIILANENHYHIICTPEPTQNIFQVVYVFKKKTSFYSRGVSEQKYKKLFFAHFIDCD